MLRRSLNSHLRTVHKYSQEEVESVQEKIRVESNIRKDAFHILCPLCEEQFVNQEDFAGHCEANHSHDGANGEEQDYTVYTVTFASKEEFKVWLHESSERTVTSLYTKYSKAGGLYYRCNRSGKYACEGERRVRSSKKEVLHCSCYVNARNKSDGTVTVKACFGHIGHDVEPALLKLSDMQKMFLKSLLEEHSLDYVIRRCRQGYSAKESRMHFMTKGDLWNIINKYGLRPGYRDANDLVSLQLRTAEENRDDGIRRLEMPVDNSGKGFIMVIITPLQLQWLKAFSSRSICVDDTHHPTRYNLKLATVVVPDNEDRGLPAAFLLSGTMTTDDVQKLFEEIKKLMPEFNPKQMVTDEALCFYNGFKAAFPSSTTTLRYCRWHISKTWERKVRELVEPRHRQYVNKELQQLLRTGQLDDFQQKFGRILAYLDVENQNKMAQYLRTNYLGRVCNWGSFGTHGAVVDTTMLSERWHLRLKNEVLHRNSNTRADCLVELLIRAVEDLADSNDIKDRRRLARSSFRTQQTTKQHRKAQELYDGKIPEKILSKGSGIWELQGKKPEEKFIVENKGGCICPSTSNVHCPLCSVCPYTWTCTCLDNRTGISCLHRHAAKISQNRAAIPREKSSAPEPADFVQRSTSEDPLAPDFEDIVQAPTSSDVCSVPQSQLEERKTIRSKIEMAFTVVMANVNRLVNSDTDEALAKLREIQEHIDKLSKLRLESSPREHEISERPELTKPGAKPLLKKVTLYTRSEHRRKLNQLAFDNLPSEVENSSTKLIMNNISSLRQVASNVRSPRTPCEAGTIFQ
ncbi:MULE domain-containing protein [Trichostrongylus colubriformis]|uniref:MULE domain-containing protein n=1 Tax=Trichostrongylus colubriformis TaxID=6319 RepID=A0AAN8IYR4_TRICO